MLKLVATTTLTIALAATSAFAQTTRVEEITRAQAEKATRLQPNVATGTEKTLEWLEGHFTDPNTVYLTFGGLYPSAGFAPGLAIRRAFGHARFSFDNATGTSTAIGAPVTGAGAQATAPAALPTGDGAFVRVQISAVDAPHRSWTVPVEAYFTRAGDDWNLVGFERLPDGNAAANAGTR